MCHNSNSKTEPCPCEEVLHCCVTSAMTLGMCQPDLRGQERPSWCQVGSNGGEWREGGNRMFQQERKGLAMMAHLRNVCPKFRRGMWAGDRFRRHQFRNKN